MPTVMYPKKRKERYDMVKKSVYFRFINTSKIYVQMKNEGSSVKISTRNDATKNFGSYEIFIMKILKNFSQKFYPDPFHREHRLRLLLPIN